MTLFPARLQRGGQESYNYMPYQAGVTGDRRSSLVLQKATENLLATPSRVA